MGLWHLSVYKTMFYLVLILIWTLDQTTPQDEESVYFIQTIDEKKNGDYLTYSWW